MNEWESPVYAIRTTCDLCRDSGQIPYPVFSLMRWYQVSYPCICQTGRKENAYSDPSRPRGLDVYELQWLFTRLKRRPAKEIDDGATPYPTLLEAAQSLVDNPSPHGRGKPIDGNKILNAVVDAMNREENQSVPF